MVQHAATFTALIQGIQERTPSFNAGRVLEGYRFARDLYADEQHWSGMSIIDHALGVLEILAPFEPDEDAILACLLHHALLTPNAVTLTELEDHFGSDVRQLVSGVHLLTSLMHGERNSIGDLRLMLLSVSDDVRTILITLCDRCFVLNSVGALPRMRARTIASDVLNLYAPVAARLGIYSLKHELERRAFPICYPSDAERITGQLSELHRATGDFLTATARVLEQHCVENGLHVQLECREKQAYSIFRKLDSKSLSSVEDIYDLFAIRVIVSTPEECYRVLGLLHTLGRPLAHRFKDYIAFPKPNGYQSLHTTLAQLPYAPKDTAIEVQVRTHAMHREAKYGVAAHWSYKEYGATRQAMEHVQLKKMLTAQEPVLEDAVHRQSLADHIFVLTPKGDVIELPEGATLLDFAFQVHTDLGLSFRSARVNGGIVPLDYQLENGDVVEILKYRTPRPSPQWMQMLRMASSRSKLKRYLNTQRRTEFVARGRELLNAELRRHGLPALDGDLTFLRSCDGEDLPLARREDLLMKIGQDSERASSVLQRLDALRGSIPSVTMERPQKSRAEHQHEHVVLEGEMPMPTRYAKCCKPQEDTRVPIIGIVNRLGEVMIHRRTCRMLKNANPERQIGAMWKQTVRS